MHLPKYRRIRDEGILKYTVIKASLALQGRCEIRKASVLRLFHVANVRRYACAAWLLVAFSHK